jgi:hypothetical protein
MSRGACDSVTLFRAASASEVGGEFSAVSANREDGHLKSPRFQIGPWQPAPGRARDSATLFRAASASSVGIQHREMDGHGSQRPQSRSGAT